MYKKVSCLGPDGSYTCLAARTMCPEAELIPCHTFAQALQAVLSECADAAVLPIENTINGGVLQNMDLLESNPSLCAVREYTLRIDHRFITLAGADKSKINRIFSHRQALDQCAGFLRDNYPEAELVAENSTAASISSLKLPTDAAIAGAQCYREGLDVSDECISDEKNNYTHFLLVIKGRVAEDAPTGKIYFSLTCAHKPGALLKILEIIYGFNLNMTKIESRPIKDKPGEYRFFIEVEGDYSQQKIKDALSTLKNSSRSFTLIGAY